MFQTRFQAHVHTRGNMPPRSSHFLNDFETRRARLDYSGRDTRRSKAEFPERFPLPLIIATNHMKRPPWRYTFLPQLMPFRTSWKKCRRAVAVVMCSSQQTWSVHQIDTFSETTPLTIVLLIRGDESDLRDFHYGKELSSSRGPSFCVDPGDGAR